jgi:hypothetical protein
MCATGVEGMKETHHDNAGTEGQEGDKAEQGHAGVLPL